MGNDILVVNLLSPGVRDRATAIFWLNVVTMNNSSTNKNSERQ